MTIRPTAAAALALAATLAACGGSTPSSSPSVRPVTVTVTSPAPDTAPTNSQTTATQTTPPTTSTTATQTRTQTAPASAGPSGGTPSVGGGLQTAVNKVRALGFTPLSTTTYAPDQTLHVLVGTRTGDSHTQQAFFFDGANYLGTDAAGASGMIAVTAHTDTDVTLRYGVYRSGDADCCPSGAPASVRFELDSGRLMALDQIPSATVRR